MHGACMGMHASHTPPCPRLAPGRRAHLRSPLHPPTTTAPLQGGERFLEIGSILRSSGVGGDEDDEAELDALVV